MALECLDAAEEQRREESTILQARMDDLASRNQQLEGKVHHLEGAYATLTDQVHHGIRNFLLVPNSLTSTTCLWPKWVSLLILLITRTFFQCLRALGLACRFWVVRLQGLRPLMNFLIPRLRVPDPMILM